MISCCLVLFYTHKKKKSWNFTYHCLLQSARYLFTKPGFLFFAPPVVLTPIDHNLTKRIFMSIVLLLKSKQHLHHSDNMPFYFHSCMWHVITAKHRVQQRHPSALTLICLVLLSRKTGKVNIPVSGQQIHSVRSWIYIIHTHTHTPQSGDKVENTEEQQITFVLKSKKMKRNVVLKKMYLKGPAFPSQNSMHCFSISNHVTHVISFLSLEQKWHQICRLANCKYY